MIPGHSWFNSVLSATDRSWLAHSLRLGLQLCEPTYAAAIYLRNKAYDWGLSSVSKVPAPVISVGNLTTGGTGKTPCVAWAVQQLQQLGCSPGILSRGYGQLASGENDEKRVLDRLCPLVPHQQQRDRIAGARVLLRQGVNALVLDDGFQHRRLARQVDLVLIDAVQPWGYGHLLPRGLLREPLAELRRADCILLTRADLVTAETLAQIRSVISRYTSVPVLATRFLSSGLCQSCGERIPISPAEWSRLPALAQPGAFCGIGNPRGFGKLLESAFGELMFLREFPDHHHYSEQDWRSLQEEQQRRGLTGWLTTLKDLVKLPAADRLGVPVYAVDIELDFIDSADPLLGMLRQALAGQS